MKVIILAGKFGTRISEESQYLYFKFYKIYGAFVAQQGMEKMYHEYN